jgi:hypothetical protein
MRGWKVCFWSLFASLLRTCSPAPLFAEIDTETEKLTKSVADLEKEREKRETQQSDDQRSIARQQKNVERYLAKRQVLLQRKDECNKNIRDLGVLPDEAFAETTATSEKVPSLFLCPFRPALLSLFSFPHSSYVGTTLTHSSPFLPAPQKAPQGQ